MNIKQAREIMDMLSPEENAQVAQFVNMVESSETERAVWREVMRSLARDFRGQGWNDAADHLEAVTNQTVELMGEIDEAKKRQSPREVGHA